MDGRSGDGNHSKTDAVIAILVGLLLLFALGYMYWQVLIRPYSSIK